MHRIVVEVAQDVLELDVAHEPDVRVCPPRVSCGLTKTVGVVGRATVGRVVGGPWGSAGREWVADVEEDRAPRGVVQDCVPELAVLRGRIEVLPGSAAVVDFDRVVPPSSELIDILLVVPIAALAGTSTAVGAGIGINAGEQAFGV